MLCDGLKKRIDDLEQEVTDLRHSLSYEIGRQGFKRSDMKVKELIDEILVLQRSSRGLLTFGAPYPYCQDIKLLIDSLALKAHAIPLQNMVGKQMSEYYTELAGLIDKLQKDSAWLESLSAHKCLPPGCAENIRGQILNLAAKCREFELAEKDDLIEKLKEENVRLKRRQYENRNGVSTSDYNRLYSYPCWTSC